VVIKKLNTLK